MIRVFIQAAAGSAEKHIYDEQTLERRSTITLARPYPFPYGFVLDTQSEDGDCVDCYVLTSRPLAAGDVVSCEPAGLLEQLEDDEPDHKVLAVFPGEAAGVEPAAASALRAFITDVFAAFPDTRLALGRLHDAEAARAHVRARQRAAPLPLMDGRVHHQVLSAFVRLGRPPSLDELARALAIAPEDAAAALRRLHDGHGLVLHPDRADVWIAHPFSASPTAVWVAAGARGWWAPCLWCASGIVALAAPTSTIHARYAGEHEAAAIEVRGGAPASGDLVVHFAIPPRDAWRNVVHWCSTVLPFRRAEDVEPWCARHGLSRGAVLPWRQVMELGRAWYGRHLDVDWRKHTIAEAQAIFDQVGLSGDFWRLPVSDRPF